MNNISTLYNYILTSTTTFNSADTVFIKSFHTGEKDDVAVSGADLYPRVFLEQPFAIYTDGPVTEYDIMLLVMDQFERDNPVDLRHKQDLTFEILQHLIEKFKRDKIYSVGQSYDISSHAYYNDDITAAWRVNLKLIQQIPVNRCENKNVFGNCHEGTLSLNFGFVETSYFYQITIDGNTYTTPSNTYFMNDVTSIQTYLNTLIDNGFWTVTLDQDTLNFTLRLNHSTNIPTTFGYYDTGYLGPAYGVLERVNCTL